MAEHQVPQKDFVVSFASMLKRLKWMQECEELIRHAPQPGEAGWMVPYVMILSQIYHNDRWGWWTSALMMQRLPDSPIPEILWETQAHHETMKHLRDLIQHCYARGAGDQAYGFIVDQILWGLNRYRKDGSSDVNVPLSKNPPPEPYPGAMQEFGDIFNLQLLMMHPYDYWGDLFAESRVGRGSKFYPTPMPVVRAMVDMTFSDERRNAADWKEVAVKSAHDPCIGTGRMMLLTGDYCLRLSGQDVNYLVLKAATINAMLYVPWMAMSGEGVVKELIEAAEADKAKKP